MKNCRRASASVWVWVQLNYRTNFLTFKQQTQQWIFASDRKWMEDTLGVRHTHTHTNTNLHQWGCNMNSIQFKFEPVNIIKNKCQRTEKKGCKRMYLLYNFSFSETMLLALMMYSAHTMKCSIYIYCAICDYVDVDLERSFLYSSSPSWLVGLFVVILLYFLTEVFVSININGIFN